MTDKHYPDPESAIRYMEDKIINEVMESILKTHSGDRYPHPIDFLEDRVVFRAFFGATVGKRSRVFIELVDNLKAKGFTHIELTENSDGIVYSLEIPV